MSITSFLTIILGETFCLLNFTTEISSTAKDIQQVDAIYEFGVDRKKSSVRFHFLQERWHIVN